MVIKEKLDEIQNDKRPWVRVLRTIALVIATIFLIGFLLTQTTNTEPEPDLPKYEVRLSNSIGGHTYHCESYKQDGNTYKLFDADSTMTNEITITDGYVIQINLSE